MTPKLILPPEFRLEGLREETLTQLASGVRQQIDQHLSLANQQGSLEQGLPERSLLQWGSYYLPHYFQAPPSKMHLWLGEQLDRHAADRGLKLNLLGPRGSAKSTVATLAFVLRSALEAQEAYIWIISDTKQQAAAHLENVKLELLDNQKLLRDYPQATGKGPLWRQNAVVLRNQVMIEALGTGQRIRGRRRRQFRPSLIVCDDLQNDGHVQSSLLRSRSRSWFHAALLKAGNPQTNLLHLATALHREALALELHTTPGWMSKIFPAILQWPAQMQLWLQWETIRSQRDTPDALQQSREFYELHREAMQAGAEVLWPEVEDLYTLMSMRLEQGRTSFEREKQNVPIHPDLCEWPEDYFTEPLWFEDWPSQAVLKVVALDPSKGADARLSDYSALVRVMLASDGRFYVEADLARRTTSQMVADGVECCRQFRPHAFALETNQFQQLLQTEFERTFAEQQVFGIPVWGLDNRVNKQVRIRRLGPLLAGKQLRFKHNSPSTGLLVQQLKDFPLSDHDDGPDALEMAIRLLHELLSETLSSDGLGQNLISMKR